MSEVGIVNCMCELVVICSIVLLEFKEEMEEVRKICFIYIWIKF